ncbi:MAG: FecCD family ABC transporter permease [Candidatus Hydrogenedentota bacterium]
MRRVPIPVLYGVVLSSTLIIMALSLIIGKQSIDLAGAWSHWRAGMTLAESPALHILLSQRLPRTLAACLAGGGLALVGCTFQAVLRNPLATPYTLGIASAGALGAYVALVLVDAGVLVRTILGIPMVQGLAFAFALADVLLIYLMASRRARPSPAVLLLTGVTLGIIANAGIMLARFFARPERLIDMDRWLMGGVDVLGFQPAAVVALVVLPGAAVLLAQAGKLDQFGFSTELAASRGVHVGRLQLVVFVVGSLITAVIVSKVGPIGFVGLIVPHSVRAFTGSRHRVLLPITFITGAGFLCLCDVVSRKMPIAGEVPIGIITTLIGGPFFLYLLLRRRFADWEA